MALRGHFRRQLGSSPAAYRAAYRARRPQSDKPSDPEGPPPPPPPQESASVPPQTRRTAAAHAVGPSASLSTEPDRSGNEMYANGRPSLPGQRSAP